MYSARLYETEQRQSDWYVEKRLMGQTIAKLQNDIQDRDRIDAQIERLALILLYSAPLPPLISICIFPRSLFKYLIYFLDHYSSACMIYFLDLQLCWSNV